MRIRALSAVVFKIKRRWGGSNWVKGLRVKDSNDFEVMSKNALDDTKGIDRKGVRHG